MAESKRAGSAPNVLAEPSELYGVGCTCAVTGAHHVVPWLRDQMTTGETRYATRCVVHVGMMATASWSLREALMIQLGILRTSHNTLHRLSELVRPSSGVTLRLSTTLLGRTTGEPGPGCRSSMRPAPHGDAALQPAGAPSQRRRLDPARFPGRTGDHAHTFIEESLRSDRYEGQRRQRTQTWRPLKTRSGMRPRGNILWLP